uniref:Uncharacterized protein n=1 Tax=Kalanchoe fedtschenkoi TaxID=63787 RepID=A0A7N0VLN5_KALFE
MDDIGHGTHTASTAGGNKVGGASFGDVLAKGTARGGLPSSRIAAYKVCRMGTCVGADMLAGFDDAIADGVDVITISLSGLRHVELAQDAIAIGSFHAMQHGIPTINSAGNYGPEAATINEIAPWLISVGASTIDRYFADTLVLGDGKTLTGRSSINVHPLVREPKYPLVYANKLNASNCSEALIRDCHIHCIDKDFIKDKIVICTSIGAAAYLRRMGAAGLILKGGNSIPTIYYLPAISLPSQDFVQVEAYANITGSRATILMSEDVKDSLAPVVASFSSRGPNYRFPDIMKPDVVSPGVGILAAYVPNLVPFIEMTETNESMAFNIMSGTSMSCPHAAGAIAYVKSLHPDWSPSALKSALMTTDYINILCGTYDAETCRKISGEKCQCPKDKIAPKDLNYPSMTIKLNATEPINASFTRVATNVGHPNSTYKADIVAAPKLTITVAPDTLSFAELNERKSFEVHVTGEIPRGEQMLSSSLVWSHGESEQRGERGQGEAEHRSCERPGDPGLIYDISEQDYINILCGTYDAETCRKIPGEKCQCPKDKIAPKDLNYPSMTIKLNATEPINVSFTRVATNVGHPNSTYKADIVAAPKLTITVAPDTLSFAELNERKSFEVHVTGEFPRGEHMLSSSLVWSHGTHNVRSPIIVYTD